MFFHINDIQQLCSAPPPSPAVVVIMYSDVPLRLIITSECDHPPRTIIIIIMIILI